MQHETIKRFSPREGYLININPSGHLMELVTILVSDYTMGYALIKDQKGEIRAEHIDKLRVIGG
jgi:hypothetical protein